MPPTHGDAFWCIPQVSKCWLVTRQHTIQELHACVDEVPAPYPTVVPSPSSRTIHTRTVGAKSKLGQEVSLQFNLCNGKRLHAVTVYSMFEQHTLRWRLFQQVSTRIFWAIELELDPHYVQARVASLCFVLTNFYPFAPPPPQSPGSSTRCQS